MMLCGVSVPSSLLFKSIAVIVFLAIATELVAAGSRGAGGVGGGGGGGGVGGEKIKAAKGSGHSVIASNKDQTSATIRSFVENVLSYGLLILPAAFLISYLKKHPENMAGNGVVAAMLRVFVVGSEDLSSLTSSSNGSSNGSSDGKPSERGEKRSAGSSKDGGSGSGSGNNNEPEETFGKRAAYLAFCVLGLQGSYLTWGVLQEQMMTQAYGVDSDGNNVYFGNSQYLVFLNRFLALIIATVIICSTNQPKHTVPMHKYSYPSMSNILSSWCQYEALKFVSFPTQVLTKACKIIPVMLMGKVVQGKTYPLYDYVFCTLMSVGVSLFLFTKESPKEDDVMNSAAAPSGEFEFASYLGGTILVGYMVFDSFTSNYQSHLFKTYKMSSYQMMFGNTLFSSIFCLWTLIQRGEFLTCLLFTSTHPLFLWHSIILSVTSATGQLFIFWTLSKYGALVFAIIMTTRQAISVFLSALIFGHEFAPQAWLGVMLVFVAMFGKIYYDQTSKGGSKG